MANNVNEQQNTNSEEDLTNDLTGEARSTQDSNEPEKAVGVGYGKDTGTQSGDSTTAGGRAGKFSDRENRSEEGLDTDWSPGAAQPRS
jgi:hypothetical protein